jgi:uncharacterized protein (TIGR03437 family)
VPADGYTILRYGKYRVSVLAALAICAVPAGAALVLSPDGTTVYDSANNINWLADANLAATEQFGLPVCNSSNTKPCVNANGSMGYTSAAAWVQAMNAANYLGHSNWQLPTSPPNDSGCGKTGPQGESFGFGCTANAMGSLYYNGLGLKAPNTAVAIPGSTFGPFNNFQPYLYWSQTPNTGGYTSFSFNTGFQGANTVYNFLYLLPMIAGKITGTPAAKGTALEVNPDGQTVYDAVSNVTWLANANLAASNTFGLPQCTSPVSPTICVGQDGSMTWAAASQFIANMNSYNYGTGYVGQSHWQLPAMDVTCTGYACSEAGDPMAELFYNQLGLREGVPVTPTPATGAGPFIHVQPYLYWSCQAATIQSPCSASVPSPNFEWSFSFGDGFLGTDLLGNDLYATAYYVGPASTSSGPRISEVLNAEGESPSIAPNTWVMIRGVNLGPVSDKRTWLASDFTGDQMPLQLDGVSVTVNGKPAYVEYISPGQVNILTPLDSITGPVQVQVNNNGKLTPVFTTQEQGQTLSPSFFVFGGGPYVAATHLDGTYLGPATLYPGYTTPAKPGDVVVLYGNGFGPIPAPIMPGSRLQYGALPMTPFITIGTKMAIVGFNGLVAAGEFQFNVTLPMDLPDGDLAITATYNGLATQAGTLITIQR